MEYRIVPMAERHLAQIAALENRCFPDPWAEALFAEELRNPLSLWLVAEAGDRILGYVGSQAVLDSADVMNLAVVPEVRRKGIGAALMEELGRELAEKGVKTLLLEVRKSNAPAISLYETMGFSLAGVRRNYYLRPREDALILQKRLEAI